MTATTTNGQAPHDDTDEHEPEQRDLGRQDDDHDQDDEFDDPALEDDQPGPTSKRTRSTRLVVAVIVVAAVAVFAARALRLGPFNDNPDPAAGTAAGGPPAQFILPQEVIDAITLAHTPGSPVAFSNRPSARDLSACTSLPAFTNEALYGMAGGDATALCERILENGAPPCSLYIGVATTEKGAVFYLSTDGSALPGQRSVPAKVAWCPSPDEQAAFDAATGVTPTTVAQMVTPVTGGQ